METSCESVNAPTMARSDTSTSNASSRSDHHLPPLDAPPSSQRPPLHSRKSSGTIIVPSTSASALFDESRPEPGNARAMSPRRSTHDIQVLGREAREELRRHAQALQESLSTIFNRIEAVKEEHDKLDNHNKFLQKYIGDLMATSKITTSTTKAKK